LVSAGSTTGSPRYVRIYAAGRGRRTDDTALYRLTSAVRQAGPWRARGGVIDPKVVLPSSVGARSDCYGRQADRRSTARRGGAFPGSYSAAARSIRRFVRAGCVDQPHDSRLIGRDADYAGALLDSPFSRPVLGDVAKATTSTSGLSIGLASVNTRELS
jgi:hypothetical protein